MGVFGSELSSEYALVVKHFVLGKKEVQELAMAPINVIFDTEEEKERLRILMRRYFEVGDNYLAQ